MFSAQSRQISVISRRKRIYTPASYVHELGLKFGIILWEGRVSFNQMMKDIKSGKDTDFVDELIFKVINAPTKRMKIEYV